MYIGLTVFALESAASPPENCYEALPFAYPTLSDPTPDVLNPIECGCSSDTIAVLILSAIVLVAVRVAAFSFVWARFTFLQPWYFAFALVSTVLGLYALATVSADPVCGFRKSSVDLDVHTEIALEPYFVFYQHYATFRSVYLAWAILLTCHIFGPILEFIIILIAAMCAGVAAFAYLSIGYTLYILLGCFCPMTSPSFLIPASDIFGRAGEGECWMLCESYPPCCRGLRGRPDNDQGAVVDPPAIEMNAVEGGRPPAPRVVEHDPLPFANVENAQVGGVVIPEDWDAEVRAAVLLALADEDSDD